MSLTESRRIEFYELLKRTSLGEEGANFVMNALPNINWEHIATRDDLALLHNEMLNVRSDVRSDLVDLENRLQRSIITWVLAAQGVTLAATSLLVTVLAFALG